MNVDLFRLSVNGAKCPLCQTRLAFGVQQLHSSASRFMRNSIIISLLIIAKCVEAACWRGGRLGGDNWRRHCCCYANVHCKQFDLSLERHVEFNLSKRVSWVFGVIRTFNAISGVRFERKLVWLEWRGWGAWRGSMVKLVTRLPQPSLLANPIPYICRCFFFFYHYVKSFDIWYASKKPFLHKLFVNVIPLSSLSCILILVCHVSYC